jgi:hypothetical protein
MTEFIQKLLLKQKACGIDIRGYQKIFAYAYNNKKKLFCNILTALSRPGSGNDKCKGKSKVVPVL